MTTKLTLSQIDKYLPCMDEELSSKYMAAILSGQKYFEVDNGLLHMWEEERERSEKRNRDILQTAKNNNAGIKFEKEGDIKKAISAYEKNIIIGYPATHSYERLMVLYRKETMPEKEMRVIDEAIEVFSQTKGSDKYIEKWNKRKMKIINKK